MKIKGRALSRNSVYLTFFLDNLGIGIIFPIFTPLLMDPGYHFLTNDPSHAKASILLGLLIASFPLAQLFSAPLIGDLSDQIGRKRAFTMTIAGSATGYVMLGLAIAIKSLSLLFISRMLTGFFSGNLTLCLASIVDVSPKEQQRSKNFSLLATIGGMSFITSVLIGGIFSDRSLAKGFSPSLPFWIIATLFYLNLFLMRTFFQETHVPKANGEFHLLKGLHNIVHAWELPHLKWGYLTFFFFMAAWVTSMQFLPSYLLTYYHLSSSMITRIFLGIGCIWGGANYIFSRYISARVHPRQYLTLSLSLLSASIFLFVFLEHLTLPGFLIHFYLCVALAATSWSSCLSNVSIQADASVQGKILGINQSFSALATIIGPISGGLIAADSMQMLYLYTSLLALCAFAMISLQKKETVS